ncbi:nucleotidyltransferase [Nibrella viscosa]|uniref:Nucleotidyltransferase n=1 Tax=Nibrella viscosa TaxID=1084524 RepID=A0ABP8KIG7_9BACT
MLSEQELAEKLRQIKPTLERQFAVSQLGYFGSYSTGEANEESDVDILVDFNQPVGWEFFRVQDVLEASIGKRVDLITPRAIKPQLKQKIFQQLKLV